MTLHEAEKALIAAVPVVYKDITYTHISGLMIRKIKGKEGYGIRAELADKCGHSVTVAPFERLELAQGDPKDLPEIDQPYEDGLGTWEQNAKEALHSSRKFEFDGDKHFVSAIIIRNWRTSDYWLDVELTRCLDKRRRIEWCGSVPQPKKF